MENYDIQLGNVSLSLPLMKASDDVTIAVFDCYDHLPALPTLNGMLLEKILAQPDLPEDLVVMTSETKGIPFGIYFSHALHADFTLLRKSIKKYIPNYISRSTATYTSQGSELYADMSKDFKDRPFLLVDDVCSTGATFEAMYQIVDAYGGHVYKEVAMFAEGSAKDRPNLIYLETLPILTDK